MTAADNDQGDPADLVATVAELTAEVAAIKAQVDAFAVAITVAVASCLDAATAVADEFPGLKSRLAALERLADPSPDTKGH